MGQHKSLRAVRLDNNLLADDGARCLGRQLRENVSLSSLDVSYNAISDAGLAALLLGLLLGPPPPQPQEHRALAKLKSVASLIRQKPILGNEHLESAPSQAAGADAEAGTVAEEAGEARDGSAEVDSKEGHKEGSRNNKEGQGNEGKEGGNAEGNHEGEEAKAVSTDKKSEAAEKATSAELPNNKASVTDVGGGGASDDDDATAAHDDDDDSEGPRMLDEEAATAAGLGPAVRKVVPKDQSAFDLMALVGPPPLLRLDISGNVLGARSRGLAKPFSRFDVSSFFFVLYYLFLSLDLSMLL
jgi:hypothetical protein